MKVEDVRKRLQEARRHLEFCVVLYRDQLARGKHFLHEHPLGASSWKEGCIERLAGKPDVSTTVGHMCRYDMKVDDELGVKKLVMKPTRWLSSSEAMLRRLSSKCQRDHEHGSLLNGKAAQAAVYLDRLCVEILKGMRDTIIENDMNQEMKDDEQSQGLINSLVVARHPEQWDKPRRGSMGTEGSPLLPNGILANVNKSQWGKRPKVFRRSYAY
jgi:hypothetical protein